MPLGLVIALACLRSFTFTEKALRNWRNITRPCAACLRCCVRVPVQASQQGGRERALSLQHQKQTRNSKLRREAERRKKTHSERRQPAQGPKRAPLVWDPFGALATTTQRQLQDDHLNGGLNLYQPTGCNHQCYNDNREERRKEGKKEGRKEGRRKKRRRGEPNGIRTRNIRFYSYVDNR